MPLQNRVTPYGEIVATPARGMLMGNRGGCMHDEQQRLGTARWRNQHWIACLLEFKGRSRGVMTPRRYTELFFLDEATAFAAGHRPCAECRRPDFLRFKAAWLRGNPDAGVDERAGIVPIDAVLHAERVTRTRDKVTYRASIDVLPDGAFVELDDKPGEAYLLWRGRLRRWSFEGYTTARPKPAGVTVRVLTPRSSVNAIAAGYEPAVHASVPAMAPGR
ncbi:MAG: hypothetical protein ACYDCQ_14755 [Dehalococcoidia bacterium]